jgi:hypothetical protein
LDTSTILPAMKSSRFFMGATLAIAAFFVKPAAAQVLIDPTIAGYSSQLTYYGDYSNNLERQAVNVVNGSGLIAGTSGILGASDSTHNMIAAGYEWWSVGNSTSPAASSAVGETPDYAPYLIFNLGGLYNVTTLRVWNENQNDGNNVPQFGAQDVAVYAGTSLSSLSFVGDEVFNEANTSSNELPQDIAVNIPDVQYVEYKILSNWDGAVFTDNPLTSTAGNDGRGLVALSEVRFEGDAIPEPSTYTLAMLGFGFCLFVARRRISA